MQDLLTALGGTLLGALAVAVGGVMLLGIPLVLLEGLFGRRKRRPRGGVYDDDGSAQELYERRLRDSHRR